MCYFCLCFVIFDFFGSKLLELVLRELLYWNQYTLETFVFIPTYFEIGPKCLRFLLIFCKVGRVLTLSKIPSTHYITEVLLPTFLLSLFELVRTVLSLISGVPASTICIATVRNCLNVIIGLKQEFYQRFFFLLWRFFARSLHIS